LLYSIFIDYDIGTWLLKKRGGAGNNAKKYIKSGAHGDKGSEAQKAAVISDTW
jgi:K(+)-stimulated pyrophosphate-energized sodium pump